MLVAVGRQLGYAEVDALSDRVAASLRALGLQPGDAVAVQPPNLPEFVLSYFGILMATSPSVSLRG